MILKIVGSGANKTYFVDGKEVTEAEFWAAAPVVQEFSGDSLIGWKPIESDALGVHPSQINEAREDAIKKGVPTDFTPTGEPILRTREHRKKYMQAYGFYDRDAGYGDAQRGSFRGDKPDPVDPRKLY
jgi:hypothetical protein